MRRELFNRVVLGLALHQAFDFVEGGVVSEVRLVEGNAELLSRG